MSQDACNFGQRDGKDCGSYPTCKKQGAAGTTNNRGQGMMNKLYFFILFYSLIKSRQDLLFVFCGGSFFFHVFGIFQGVKSENIMVLGKISVD